MNPTRIKLERKKGWRKPANTVVVSRPTKWGNPFQVAEYAGAIDPNALAVAAYKKWIFEPPQDELREQMVRELRGKNLACWCRYNQACHADVMLEIANAPN